MYCVYCGKEMADEGDFCPYCGMPRGKDEDYMDDGPEQEKEPKYIVSAGGLVFERKKGGQSQPVRDTEDIQDGRLTRKRWTSRDGVEHKHKEAIRPKLDRDFLKYVAQPLPMRPLKIILSCVYTLCAGLQIVDVYRAEGFSQLAQAIPKGLPPVQNGGDFSPTGMAAAALSLALFWVAAALIGFFVRFSKGATLTAGVFLFMAAGIAITTKEYLDFGLYYALSSFAGAVIFLISGVGGVSMDGLE